MHRIWNGTEWVDQMPYVEMPRWFFSFNDLACTVMLIMIYHYVFHGGR